MGLFDSTPAQPASKIEPGSYAQALYGLHHDRGVSENIFAARAKTHFSDLIHDIPKVLELPKHELFPLWVDQQTLAFRLKDLPTSPRADGFDEASQPLGDMVVRLAHSVLDTYHKSAPGQVLVLVGSLAVRVQDIGGGKFSFALKQKWGFQDG